MSELDTIILGYCIQDNTCLARCVDLLTSEHFEDEAAHIFGAICTYYKQYRKRISVRILEEKLEEELLDADAVIECIDTYKTAKKRKIDLEEFDYHLDQIRNRFLSLRFLSVLDGDTTDDSVPSSLRDLAASDPKKAYNVLRQRVGLVIDSHDSDDRAARGTIGTGVAAIRNRYMQVKHNPEEAFGLRTGFEVIDEETAGLRPGELFVISGASASGKSIFLLNVANNIYNAGGNVLLLSLEMPREQYQFRFHACNSDLPIKGIQRGKLGKEQEKMLFRDMESVENNKENFLFVVDIPGATALTIEAELNRVVAELEDVPDVIIVDYLGIMRSIDGTGRSDWEEQARAAEELRRLARDREIPVITAVQMNRDKKRGKGLDRIARSKIIGDTADIVLQIEEPTDDEDGTESLVDDTLRVFFSKNRKGRQHFSFGLWKNYDNMKLRNKDAYIDVAGTGTTLEDIDGFDTEAEESIETEESDEEAGGEDFLSM